MAEQTTALQILERIMRKNRQKHNLLSISVLFFQTNKISNRLWGVVLE